MDIPIPKQLELKKYTLLRTPYEVGFEGVIGKAGLKRHKAMIAFCDKVRELLEDEMLWRHEVRSRVHGIRLKLSIVHNIMKGIILIHRHHVNALLNLATDHKVLTYAYNRKLLKVVLLAPLPVDEENVDATGRKPSEERPPAAMAQTRDVTADFHQIPLHTSEVSSVAPGIPQMVVTVDVHPIPPHIAKEMEEEALRSGKNGAQEIGPVEQIDAQRETSPRLPISSAIVPSAQLAAIPSFDEIIALDVPVESARPENVMGITTEPVIEVAQGSATHLPTPFDDTNLIETESEYLAKMKKIATVSAVPAPLVDPASYYRHVDLPRTFVVEAEVHPIPAIHMDDVEFPSVVLPATAQESELLVQPVTTEPELCGVSMGQEVLQVVGGIELPRENISAKRPEQLKQREPVTVRVDEPEQRELEVVRVAEPERLELEAVRFDEPGQRELEIIRVDEPEQREPEVVRVDEPEQREPDVVRVGEPEQRELGEVRVEEPEPREPARRPIEKPVPLLREVMGWEGRLPEKPKRVVGRKKSIYLTERTMKNRLNRKGIKKGYVSPIEKIDIYEKRQFHLLDPCRILLDVSNIDMNDIATYVNPNYLSVFVDEIDYRKPPLNAFVAESWSLPFSRNQRTHKPTVAETDIADGAAQKASEMYGPRLQIPRKSAGGHLMTPRMTHQFEGLSPARDRASRISIMDFMLPSRKQSIVEPSIRLSHVVEKVPQPKQVSEQERILSVPVRVDESGEPNLETTADRGRTVSVATISVPRVEPATTLADALVDVPAPIATSRPEDAAVLVDQQAYQIPDKEGQLVDQIREMDIMGPRDIAVQEDVPLLRTEEVNAEIRAGEIEQLQNIPWYGKPAVISREQDIDEREVVQRRIRITKSDVLHKATALMDAATGAPVQFSDVCPPTTTSRRVAALTFGCLLELHAEKKFYLSRDPENPSSESILIHPAESVTQVVVRIKANF